MIYVTQGHSQGIGIEVFCKSFSFLPPSLQKKFVFVAQHSPQKSSLKTLLVKNSSLSPSLSSIKLALEHIGPKDVLLTLPTSKEELTEGGKTFLGHTEYLRHTYNAPFLPMVFRNDQECHLLLTDHIPLSSVTSTLSEEMIIQKVSQALKGLSHFFHQKVKTLIFAGIIPHAGEKGLLGNEDSLIQHSLASLKKMYPSLKIHGPLPGDTLHRYSAPSVVKIFSFHDQSLPYFKGMFDWFGLNVTLGLPFLRMSVTHGTAFDLFGKEKADYRGAYYQLLQALKVHDVYLR